MNAMAVFVLAAVGTYVLRASMLVGLAGRSLPSALQARLTLVGPAALAALCAASLAPGPGRALAPADVLAAAAAFIAVRRTGSVVHAFVVGLPVLWLAHAAGLS